MLDKNVKAYLSAIDAAAIYILIDDGKPVLIGAAKNLDLVARKLHTQKFGWVAWGQKYQDLVAICRFQNIEVLLEKNLADCVEGIVQIAESRNIILTPHEVVMERARKLAERIEQRFRELKRNGDLRNFNKAYQRYRFEQKKIGKTVLPYFGIMKRFRRITIKVLLEGKQDYRTAMLENLHKEFPWWSTYSRIG